LDIRDLRDTWERLAQLDPLWSILSDPQKKGNKWVLHEFLGTGEEEVAGLIKHIESLQVNINRRKALDFGCGVGRITQPLADHFLEVCGVDIAPTMIALARKYNRRGDRCKYYLNEKDELKLFADGTFDLVYSSFTLQHMEPKYSLGYLGEFLRVLVPGGLLVFRLPSELRSGLANWLFRGRVRTLYYWVRYGNEPRLEMYGVKKHDVMRFLETNGATVLQVTQDDSAGKDWLSYLSCVTKN